jgi:hypothetical protein
MLDQSLVLLDLENPAIYQAQVDSRLKFRDDHVEIGPTLMEIIVARAIIKKRKKKTMSWYSIANTDTIWVSVLPGPLRVATHFEHLWYRERLPTSVILDTGS